MRLDPPGESIREGKKKEGSEKFKGKGIKEDIREISKPKMIEKKSLKILLSGLGGLIINPFFQEM